MLQCSVINRDTCRRVELNRASMSIYHIGNNPSFHGPIWQVSRQHPGLVILHDLRLQHFFAGLYLGQWSDPSGYLTQMELHYGWVGRQDAESFLIGLHTTEYMAEHYPLTSLGIGYALGVLVHTWESFDVLKQENRWPVAYAPLPYAISSHTQLNWSKAETAQYDSIPYRLIVFGHIGPNRCLEVLLQALAEFPAREQFYLDIYGQLWDREGVLSLIRALHLERTGSGPWVRAGSRTGYGSCARSSCCKFTLSDHGGGLSKPTADSGLRPAQLGHSGGLVRQPPRGCGSLCPPGP